MSDDTLVRARTGTPRHTRDAGQLDEDRRPPTQGTPRRGLLTKRNRTIIACVLIALALLSIFVVGPILSSPDTYPKTIASLDEKKDNVTALTGTATVISIAVTAAPGDLATPIAEQVADIGHDFLIVLAAIYLEKYLLTTLAFVSSFILMPVGLVSAAISFLRGSRRGPHPTFLSLGAKLFVFGLVACMVVPASSALSRMIDNTYQDSLQETMEVAHELEGIADVVMGTAEENGVAVGATADAQTTGAADEPFDPIKAISDLLANIGQAVEELPETVAGIPGAVSELLSKARLALSNLVEAFAVMIVTSCLVPILTLLFFMWVANLILGINTREAMRAFTPRTYRKYRDRLPRGTRREELSGREWEYELPEWEYDEDDWEDDE